MGRPKIPSVERKCEQCGGPFYCRANPRQGLGRFCGNPCSRASKIVPFSQRFWSKVNKDPGQGPKGECWEWRGGRDPDGYGTISHTRAHRVSWELHNGPIPHDLCVLHRCDNPPCVNPDHLFLGTRGDNNKDTAQKGRHKGRAILTDAQVREIKWRYNAGDITYRALGLEYGISQWAVGDIVTHRRWVRID